MADPTNSGTIQPPSGLDTDDLINKMRHFFRTHYNAAFRDTDTGFAVQIKNHPIDDYKIGPTKIPKPHVLHVNNEGHVEIRTQNDKERDAQILATLHAAKDLWGGECHIHDGDDAFARRVRELANQHAEYRNLTITRGPQMEVLQAPMAPTSQSTPTPANTANRTRPSRQTTVAPIPQMTVTPGPERSEPGSFVEAQQMMDEGRARAAAFKASVHPAEFRRNLQVVQVVTPAEQKILADLFERNKGSDAFAKRMKAAVYAMEVDETGKIDDKSAFKLAKLEQRYGPDIQVMSGIIQKLSKFAQAKDECFLLPSEKVEFGPLLHQLVGRNNEESLKKTVGANSENAYMLVAPNGEVVSGGNYVGYGNNPGRKTDGVPTTFGVFTFVREEFRGMNVGKMTYNASKNLATAALSAVPSVNESMIKEGRLLRFAEINFAPLMPPADANVDDVGSGINQFERMRYLQKELGYRALDFGAVEGLKGLRYIEPLYDDTGGTRYCHKMVAEADITRGADGKAVAGPLHAVSVGVKASIVLIQLEHEFEQTFDGLLKHDAEVRKLLAGLRKVVKANPEAIIPVMDPVRLNAELKVAEDRSNAIKALVGDKQLNEFKVRVDVGAPRMANTTLAASEIRSAPKDTHADRKALSLEVLYNHATVSLKQVAAISDENDALVKAIRGAGYKDQRISFGQLIDAQIAQSNNQPLPAFTATARSAAAPTSRVGPTPRGPARGHG